MKTIGYTRVSSKKQIENNSLEMQRDKILRYAEYKELGEVTFFADEGISGRSVENRYALKDVLELVEAGEVSHFIAYSSSRMGRNLKEVLQVADLLDKHKVTMHLLDIEVDTSKAQGALVFRILSSLNQYFSDSLSEKTLEAHEYLYKQGKQYSPPVFGFEQNGKGSKLIPIEREMKVVNRVFKLRESGLSMNKIAAQVKSAGKNGGKMYASTIKNILDKKELYSQYLK